MDIKYIEKRLRDYKRKKCIVETTLARIKVYEEYLQDPNRPGIFVGMNKEPGMPSGKGPKISPVEVDIIRSESNEEIVKQWIKNDKSRIYPLQIELEQIHGAFNAISMQQQFIIECKYFEGMFWRDVELSFNEKFRQQNFITSEGLKKLNKQTLGLLYEILHPYYNRFK